MTFRERGITDQSFGSDPVNPDRGSRPGVIIAPMEQIPMAKAPKDGSYTVTQGGETFRFRVRAGDVVPEGATFIDPDEPVDTKKAKRGPSEDTKAAGPSEKEESA